MSRKGIEVVERLLVNLIVGWYIVRDLSDVFPGYRIVALTAVRATI